MSDPVVLPGTVQSLLSCAAFVVSLVSVYLTRTNWLQSNRPVVSAFITEHESGSNASTFNLVVANTGNRPAVNVRLLATNDELRRLVEPGASERHFDMITSNFSERSAIPLLRNGEELTTSFGAYTANGAPGPWLNYGATAEITVLYEDMDGRSYRARQPVKVYARNGFGGGSWS